jgi:tripartite-type tricarboxylate transporter receptor subunit TctC
MFKDPEFIATFEKQGLEIDVMLGDDYGKYLQDNETQFKSIWDAVKDQYKN